MLKIDLHLHTIASRHAHNTILEYINQAKKLRMKVIGISDHGPSDESTTADEVYFMVIGRIPKVINGIRVLKGIEANIIDSNGNLDISNDTVNRLDYVLANFHEGSIYKDQGIKKNTDAMIKTVRSGKINIISHPFHTAHFPIDITRVAEEACKNNVLLEIDLHYIDRHINKGKSLVYLGNIKEIVRIVKKNKKKIIVNSDSHNIWELADDRPLKKIQKEIGLTNNLIINNYPRELFRLLKINE